MPDLASGVRVQFVGHHRAVRADAEAAVLDLWARHAAELSDRSMAAFVSETVRLVDAAHQQVATATVAYLDLLERVVTGRRSGRYDAGPVDVGTQRGVEPGEVWRRPVIRAWRALAEGEHPQRAAAIGAARVRELLTTGLQLAHTRTALGWMATAPVDGYRRSLSGPCGMCVLASTVWLAPDEPMPIHPHCGCVAWPRFAGYGPLRAGGEPGGEAARQAVVELTGESVVNERAFHRHLAIVTHGEIGPMLRRAGHHFTGPSDIHAA